MAWLKGTVTELQPIHFGMELVDHHGTVALEDGSTRRFLTRHLWPGTTMAQVGVGAVVWRNDDGLISSQDQSSES